MSKIHTVANKNSFYSFCYLLRIFVKESSWGLHTRVAAEGHFPCGCVGLCDAEVPVLVEPHCGSVGIPAGVGKQEVLKARQHLRKTAENRKLE